MTMLTEVIFITLALVTQLAIGGQNGQVQQQQPETELEFLGQIEDLDVQQAGFLNYVASDKVYLIGAGFGRLNWYSAHQYCAYQNMSLASINSLDDNEALRSFLIQNGGFANNEIYWLGATDIAINRYFVWFNTGRPLVYTNWARGEPNNIGGREHCVSWQSDGRWRDSNCRRLLNFICEER